MIDLRSDSSIPPTAAMREAMANTPAGDDFYEESAETALLQRYAAEILGKEEALLLPTGTMANYVAILAHGCEPDRLFLDARSHLRIREMNAPGPLAAHSPALSDTGDGCPDPDTVACWLEKSARSSLVCVENSHLWRGGKVIPPDRLDALRASCARSNSRIHLDGARLFNAAAATGASPASAASCADSVMVSLVKGIGAPYGAILAGTSGFTRTARAVRQIFGGTVRQPGPLAAAALTGLEEGFAHIAVDHANARKFAEMIGGLPGMEHLPASVETNIVLFDPRPLGLATRELLVRAWDRGVKLSVLGSSVRAVTHRGVTAADVAAAGRIVREILTELDHV